MYDDLPKNCDQAYRRGAASFFTGRPCKFGHLVPRTLGGKCRECVRLKRQTPKFKEWSKQRRLKAKKELSRTISDESRQRAKDNKRKRAITEALSRIIGHI